MSYPWYEILNEDDDTINQGDFIENCPILEPPQGLTQYSEIDTVEVSFKELDVIVLSQSCDLSHSGKIDIVLVSPLYPYDSYFKNNVDEAQQSPRNYLKLLEKLKKGEAIGYHLLDRDKTNTDTNLTDLLVVDFKNVYGINYSALTSISRRKNKRVRLLPPYREHLSQSFARFFMRVGLPQDIDISNEKL